MVFLLKNILVVFFLFGFSISLCESLPSDIDLVLSQIAFERNLKTQKQMLIQLIESFNLYTENLGFITQNSDYLVYKSHYKRICSLRARIVATLISKSSSVEIHDIPLIIKPVNFLKTIRRKIKILIVLFLGSFVFEPCFCVSPTGSMSTDTLQT